MVDAFSIEKEKLVPKLSTTRTENDNQFDNDGSGSSRIVNSKTLFKHVTENCLDELELDVKYYPENGVNADSEPRKYRYENYNNRTILIIACTEDIVETKTLNKLCLALKEKYLNIDYTDDMFYGWEPLHYVARTANLDKLEVILNHTRAELIHSLTYFSENALHVLLQYENSITPYIVVLHNGVESKFSAVIGPEKDNIVKCARLLIQRGLDVNHTNFWNEPPICLAVRNRYTNVIKELLTIDNIDLDSFAESGRKIRDYLKWNIENNLPQHYIQEDAVRLRFNYLKSGDDDKFLKYNGDILSDNANRFDGNNEDASSGTMLQLCMRKGFYEFFQENIDLTTYDIKNNPMLTIFKSKGLIRCIMVLLDNGADPSKTSRKFNVNLLEYSALRGYYPLVAILLQHKHNKLGANDIIDVLKKMLTSTLPTFNNKVFYINCVFRLLINKLVMLFESVEEKRIITNNVCTLKELLSHLILKNDVKINHSEMICQILYLGANLATRVDETDSTPSQSNSNDQPNPDSRKIVLEYLHPSILAYHFDNCIHGTRFEYGSIIEDEDNRYNETIVLNSLTIDESKRDLLRHPLIMELTERKWSKLQRIFILDLVYYALLLFTIYVYMIYLHLNKFKRCFNAAFYILVFFLILLVIKEGLQLCYLYRKAYRKELSNILEVSTIVTCVITMIYPNICTSVQTILYATFILFLMLGQLPYFTHYTIIFGSIKYFVKYTLFYFIQFFSFAICFYMIFPFEKKKSDSSPVADADSSSFWSVLNDIFKNLFFTFIYFTGEFGDRVLEPQNNSVFAMIIMLLFILCMTLILNQLLQGFIVANMSDIQESNRLYKQVKLATFVHNTNIFLDRLQKQKFTNWIDNKIEKLIKNLNIFKSREGKNIDIDGKAGAKEIQEVPICDRLVLNDIYTSLKQHADSF